MSLSRRLFFRKAAQTAAVVATASVPAVAGVDNARLTVEEFLSEADKAGFVYYIESRDAYGRLCVACSFPMEGGDLDRWRELQGHYDDSSRELAKHLSKVGRYQGAVAHIRAGTFTPRPDFRGNWDAGAYVDYAVSAGERCESYYRGEKLVAYTGWLSELVGPDEPRKHGEFIVELKRRGRAHVVPEGVTVLAMMRSIEQESP